MFIKFLLDQKSQNCETNTSTTKVRMDLSEAIKLYPEITESTLKNSIMRHARFEQFSDSEKIISWLEKSDKQEEEEKIEDTLGKLLVLILKMSKEKFSECYKEIFFVLMKLLISVKSDNDCKKCMVKENENHSLKNQNEIVNNLKNNYLPAINNFQFQIDSLNEKLNFFKQSFYQNLNKVQNGSHVPKINGESKKIELNMNLKNNSYFDNPCQTSSFDHLFKFNPEEVKYQDLEFYPKPEKLAVPTIQNYFKNDNYLPDPLEKRNFNGFMMNKTNDFKDDEIESEKIKKYFVFKWTVKKALFCWDGDYNLNTVCDELAKEIVNLLGNVIVPEICIFKEIKIRSFTKSKNSSNLLAFKIDVESRYKTLIEETWKNGSPSDVFKFKTDLLKNNSICIYPSVSEEKTEKEISKINQFPSRYNFSQASHSYSSDILTADNVNQKIIELLHEKKNN